MNLTDDDGAVTKTYKYDAFGVEKNISDTDTNAFRYCGEYFDKETGTIYLRARYYNPSTGRFTQRDSFAGKNEFPLSLNLYTYCHNNPILHFDPSGNVVPMVAASVILGSAAVSMWSSNISQASQNDGDWARIDVKKTAVAGGKAAAFSGAMMLPGVREASLGSTMAWAGTVGFATESAGSLREYGQIDYSNALLAGSWSAVSAGTVKCIDVRLSRLFDPLGTNRYFPLNPLKPSSFADLMSEEEAMRYNQYWGKNALDHATPGIKFDHYKFNGSIIERSTVIYDYAGRQQYRIDYNDHGYIDHSKPHFHEVIYGAGYEKGWEQPRVDFWGSDFFND